MTAKQLVVLNELGIHARIAGELARCTQSFQCSVTACKDGRRFNLKSIIEVMLMACGQGETLELCFDGPDEEAAAQAVEELFARRFGEAPQNN